MPRPKAGGVTMTDPESILVSQPTKRFSAAEMYALMTDMVGVHQRKVPPTPHVPYELRSASLGSIAVAVAGCGVPVSLNTPVTELGVYVVQFPLTSEIRVAFRGRTRDVRAPNGVVYSPSQSCFVERTPGWMLAATIQGDLVRARAAKRLGTRLVEPLVFEICITDAAEELAGMLLLLASAIDTGAVKHGTLAAQTLQEAVADLFVLRQPHNYSDGPPAVADVADDQRIAAAEAYVSGNLAGGISTRQLAQAAGCSVRMLQATFSERFGLPPMAFVRRRRLEAARQMLRSPGVESVASVARAVGYANTGRFAADYRSQFGERPSRTLQLNRIAGMAERHQD